MKWLAMLSVLLVLAGCRAKQNPVDPESAQQFPNETPILRASPGDCWEYRVVAEIHKADGSSERRESSRSRRFLGQREPLPGKGRFDTFEVSEDGKAVELEFIEVQPDEIRLWGSQSLRNPQDPPMILAHGVPFVRTGLRGGEDLPLVQVGVNASNPETPAATRKLRVIGRERVQLAAGSFDTIRLLMTGMEGPFELRRTIWYAPGDGIVQEQKDHYAKGRLVATEQHELVALRRTKAESQKGN